MSPLNEKIGYSANCLDECFSPPGSFAPRGHLSTSGNVFGCHNWKEGAPGIQWVEARGAANIVQCVGKPPNNKELSGPKCQECED